jgi:hypothetical protein
MPAPVDLVVIRRAALVEAVNEITHVSERSKGLVDIAGADDGQIFERSGGGFGDNIREPGGAALRNDHGPGAGRVGAADDRAQIVRILHTIENHKEPGFRRYIAERRILLRRSQRDHSLMRLNVRYAIESTPVFEAHRNSGLTGEIHYLLDARTGNAAGNQDALERPFCAQGFNDGVDSGKKGQMRL